MSTSTYAAPTWHNVFDMSWFLFDKSSKLVAEVCRAYPEDTFRYKDKVFISVDHAMRAAEEDNKEALNG